MCAPVLGAGRNGPYIEEDSGKAESNGMGFLFDTLTALSSCLLLFDCFSNAKGKYAFLSLLTAMIKMIEE